MATPDYALQTDFSWWEGTEARTLPAGTFVRPVEYQYVPKHVKEDDRWKNYDEAKKVFVYCSKGFLMISRSSMRKV